MGVQTPAEQLKGLADKLRARSGIQYSSAKLDLEHDGFRVEYIRGKDFERFFQEHPELANFVDPGKQKSVDERIAEVGLRFLKNGILRRTERKFKKPKPGKPRLVKWPKTLEAVSPYQSQVWDKSSFYAWQYDRPTSAWLYFWATLMVVAVIASCLLPIAPYKVKIVVFYSSLTLLSVIMGFITIRFSLWLAVWLATGREFWFLPNALSDEVGLKDAFTPLISFEMAKGLKSHWLTRVFFLLLIGASVYFLRIHKPENKDVKDSFRKAHDDILEFLSLHDPGLEKLGKGTEADPAAPPKEEL
ncbi:hypothetical protein BSKO_06988 [Bryopsis sp. KO-2023]|nr:hypothetical protein BSKO_06988 [Bryopsis sp. KO-2023]